MARTPTPTAGEKPATPPALLGAAKLDATIRVGDADIQLGEFVRAAFNAAAPMTVEAWNALSDADRHDRVVAQIEAAKQAASGETRDETDDGSDHTSDDGSDHTSDDELVEARALLAFGDHQVDDIVAGTTAAIEALEAEGKVDAHPDAVAFAKSLQDD